MNNTVFGKYQPSNTFIHNIDSRIKIIGLIIFMVSIFLKYGSKDINEEYMTLVVLSFFFTILLIISFIAKMNFLTVFKQLRYLWVMILFLLFFNLFMPSNLSSKSEIAFNLFNYPIYYYSLININYIIARLILLLFASLIFTTTTKPVEITRSIEWLFSGINSYIF